MKKYDSLLKRVEQFERLAVYGDRTTFLQAIAADTYGFIPRNLLTPDLKSKINGLISTLSAHNQNPLANKLTDFLRVRSSLDTALDTVDANALADVISQASSALPGDMNEPSKVSALELSQTVRQLVPQRKLTTWEDMKTKPDPVIELDSPAATKGYASIPKETQDQLNQILLPYEKIAVPLKVDGVLGPATQKALDAFKQTYSKPATPAAIKEIYLQVKHPELVTKAPF